MGNREPKFAAPKAAREPGWEPVDPLYGVGAKYSFVSSDTSGERLRVSYFRRKEDGALVGKVWFGSKAEGPPHHAHGGSIAAVLDEAMGAAAWMIGHTVVVARLVVVFRRAVPLGTDATVEAQVTKKKGKKVWASGRLLDSEGRAFAEAQGLFISLRMERFRDGGKHANSKQRSD